jgi:hypothetical protein
MRYGLTAANVHETRSTSANLNDLRLSAPQYPAELISQTLTTDSAELETVCQSFCCFKNSDSLSVRFQESNAYSIHPIRCRNDQISVSTA